MVRQSKRAGRTGQLSARCLSCMENRLHCPVRRNKKRTLTSRAVGAEVAGDVQPHEQGSCCTSLHGSPRPIAGFWWTVVGPPTEGSLHWIFEITLGHLYRSLTPPSLGEQNKIRVLKTRILLHASAWRSTTRIRGWWDVIVLGTRTSLAGLEATPGYSRFGRIGIPPRSG